VVTRMMLSARRRVNADLVNQAEAYFESHAPSLSDIESLEF